METRDTGKNFNSPDEICSILQHAIVYSFVRSFCVKNCPQKASAYIGHPTEREVPSISTTFNVSEMMKGKKKYRYNCRRKLFTSDRRVKLFVFTLLLITAIGMEITSGREQTGIISES